MPKSATPQIPFDITEDSEEFWKACEAGEFKVQRCEKCATWQFYPRFLCSTCGSDKVVLQKASGRGTVWSYSRVERATGEFANKVPYVVALVRLEEGPVLMTNVVDCGPQSVTLDMPVEVRFEKRLGRMVPVFAPQAKR
jgi:uncharacterized protein